jgi:predicted Fe-Mo cluster-binding NifX family protein
MRLVDLQGLSLNEAAGRRWLTRAAFRRLLSRSRRAVVLALDEGRVLHIGCESASGGHPPAGQDARGPTPSHGGKKQMRIAVTSDGPNLDGPVDPRFGRAAGFVIVDPDTMASDYVENGASQAMAQGAGIHAAELMARHDVGIVLTGYIGPKAFQALAAAGIRTGQNLDHLTVRQAVEQYKAGKVALAEAPNRHAHGGPA